MKVLPIVAALLSLGASAPAWAAVDLTLFSWENQHHDFRIGQSGTGEFITVQNTDPLGITDGSYSAEVATTATTNFYRGAWSSALADALEGNGIVKVDFAVKNPAANTNVNVVFSVIVAGREVASGTPLYTAEAASENRIRAQAGTAILDFGMLAPQLSAGVLEARVEFRVVRQAGFTGSLYFDNFRVETAVVPEPASVALASLVGLAMIRRRR